MHLCTSKFHTHHRSTICTYTETHAFVFIHSPGFPHPPDHGWRDPRSRRLRWASARGSWWDSGVRKAASIPSLACATMEHCMHIHLHSLFLSVQTWEYIMSWLQKVLCLYVSWSATFCSAFTLHLTSQVAYWASELVTSTPDPLLCHSACLITVVSLHMHSLSKWNSED